MLNHDDAERLLPPTDKRRREARQQGQVARSPELTSSVMMLAASLLMWSNAPSWAASLISSLQKSASTGGQGFLATPTVETLTQGVSNILIQVLLPFFAMLFLVGLAANLIQTGWIWNPGAILPRWRMPCIAAWERTSDFTASLLRIVVLAGLVWIYVSRQYAVVISLGGGEPATMLVHSVRLIGELFIQVSTTLVLLGLINYGVCYWRHEKRLMMTPEERRLEQKDEEVDPRFKKQRAAAA